MNITRIVNVVAVVVLCTAMAACGKKTSGTPADVEDRGISAEENAAIDGAQTRALGDDGSIGGTELTEEGSPLSIRVLYFDYDSDAIKEEYRPVVEAHARYLAENPNRPVTLEGHADERGSREYNLALGERRALSVRRQMVLLGASAAQIRTVSYGEERPAAEGTDEASMSANRRVEIVY